MNQQSIHVPYKVSLLGVVVGVAAVALPYLAAKANRIVPGEGYLLWDLSHPVYTVLLITSTLLGAAAVWFAVRGDSSRAAVVSLAAGSGLFVFGWLLIGAAGQELYPQTDSPGRVSPAAGFWLFMLAAYVHLNNGLHQLRSGSDSAESSAPVVRTRTVSFITVVLLSGFLAVLLASGYLSSLGVLKEFGNQRSRFVEELLNHLTLSGAAVLAAVIIGVPLGIVAWKRRSFEQPVFLVVNGIQTIPSLALFGIMIAPLAWLSRQFPVLRGIGIQGVGNAPALIALTLYALLPITRNTYTSLSIIDRAVIDAATGVGMGRFQLLRFVEVPLSLPIILGGIRISAVQAVGNTAVAALIGAGGLGTFVFQGLGQAAPDLILLGVFPIILLAVLVDRIMKFLVEYLTPRGIRTSREEGEKRS
ncbi:ABC transporter permease [Salinispira pacifica]